MKAGKVSALFTVSALIIASVLAPTFAGASSAGTNILPHVKYTLNLRNGEVYDGNLVLNSTGLPSLGEAGIAYDSGNGFLYVTNLFDNISVVDTKNMSLVRNLHVGSEPFDIVYDRVNGKVYSSNYNQQLSVINGKTGNVSDSINTYTYSGRMAVDNQTNTLFMLSLVYTSYETVNLNGNDTLGNVSLGYFNGSLKHPVPGIAYDYSNNTVFAANFDNYSIVVLNATSGQIVKNIRMGDQVGALYMDGATNTLYAAVTSQQRVAIINCTNYAITGSVLTGTYPSSITADNSGGFLYVTNELDSNVSVYSLKNSTFLQSINLSSGSTGAYFVPSQGYLYVINSGTGLLSVIYSSTSQTSPQINSYPYYALVAAVVAATVLIVALRSKLKTRHN